MMRRPAVAVALLTALVATFAACGGGGGSDEVDQKAFDAAFEDLEAAIPLAEAGDFDAAEARFLELHAFTHRVDSRLRAAAQPELAREMFDAVTTIETNLAGDRDAARLAAEMTKLLVLLARAAPALGYDPPPP